MQGCKTIANRNPTSFDIWKILSHWESSHLDQRKQENYVEDHAKIGYSMYHHASHESLEEQRDIHVYVHERAVDFNT
jgi:hypothetical protein